MQSLPTTGLPSVTLLHFLCCYTRLCVDSQRGHCALLVQTTLPSWETPVHPSKLRLSNTFIFSWSTLLELGLFCVLPVPWAQGDYSSCCILIALSLLSFLHESMSRLRHKPFSFLHFSNLALRSAQDLITGWMNGSMPKEGPEMFMFYSVIYSVWWRWKVSVKTNPRLPSHLSSTKPCGSFQCHPWLFPPTLVRSVLRSFIPGALFFFFFLDVPS